MAHLQGISLVDSSSIPSIKDRLDLSLIILDKFSYFNFCVYKSVSCGHLFDGWGAGHTYTTFRCTRLLLNRPPAEATPDAEDCTSAINCETQNPTSMTLVDDSDLYDFKNDLIEFITQISVLNIFTVMDRKDLTSTLIRLCRVFARRNADFFLIQCLMQRRSFCLRKIADESRWIRIADFRNIAIEDSASICPHPNFAARN